MRHSRHVLAASSAREGGQLVTSAGTPRSTSPRPRPRRRRRARRTSPRSRRSSSTGPSRPRAPPTSRAARGGTRCGRSVRPRRCTRRADASSTAPWRDPCPHVRGRWRTSRDGEAAHLGLFQRAARLGSAAAMVDAGLMCWEDGRREEAVGYYRSAADLGHPVGMCNLGVSFLEADPPKAEEAIRWFYPSASAGNARAQYNLGLCLQNGKGVKRSQKEAAKWYLRAAEGGNVRAMYNISLCYSYGEGLSQDPVRGKRWLQLAADCGHKKALYECGIKLCAAGDKVKSLMYLELATRRGESAAAHMRDVIFESLSVVNKQRAMSDADKWKPRTLHPRR